MNIVIIKYNAGNIESVNNALLRLGVSAEITGDHDKIRRADKVIFPGVGEASTTMAYLKKEGLDKLIPELKQPVLGICLGLQLMCSHSEEGDSTLTGIIPLKTRLFSEELQVKVPHTGWNKVFCTVECKLFNGIPQGSHFYFVHSYFIEFNSTFTLALAEYGIKFSAVIQKDNFYGVQFHPEKSGLAGEQLLKNFAHLA